MKDESSSSYVAASAYEAASLCKTFSQDLSALIYETSSLTDASFRDESASQNETSSHEEIESQASPQKDSAQQ